AEFGSLTACESASYEIFRAALAAGSADRLPELDARLRRPHCVGDIQDRVNLKIGEGSELGCGFGQIRWATGLHHLVTSTAIDPAEELVVRHARGWRPL